jgi:hypothetical protein
MQSEDLYKLIHQAAMGSEHAIENRAAARDYLYQEIDTLQGTSDEPLMETLSPDGSLVRVNLRPFLNIHSDIETLLQAFIETATSFPGDPARLKTYMGTALVSSKANLISLDSKALEEFFTEMMQLDYPAVHHSSTYIRLYAPAYRVIHLANFPSLISM